MPFWNSILFILYDLFESAILMETTEVSTGFQPLPGNRLERKHVGADGEHVSELGNVRQRFQIERNRLRIRIKTLDRRTSASVMPLANFMV